MREPLSLWRGETCLLEKVREMRGLFERGIGLMGRKEMPPAWGQALYFPNTRSLHTFGMRFALDVIFLDAGGTVLKKYSAVPAGRTVLGPRGSRHALEASAGQLASLQEGDILHWCTTKT